MKMFQQNKQGLQQTNNNKQQTLKTKPDLFDFNHVLFVSEAFGLF